MSINDFGRKKLAGSRVVQLTFMFSVLVVCAISLRVILYLYLPVFVTADSWDYVLAARDLGDRIDFFSAGLRDWRTPGYPILLAFVYRFSQSLQSNHIVAIQVALGVMAMLLGGKAGVLAGSRVTAIGMAIFLAINPVYLLFEHAVMTETLSIVSVSGYMVAVLWASKRRERPVLGGLAVGALFSLCILTRSNLLLFCMIGITCVPLSWYACRQRRTTGGIRHAWRFFAAVVLTAVVLVGPWLVRNGSAYGDFTLLKSINRNLLVYKSMYDPVDLDLPKIRAITEKLGTQDLNYDWLARLTSVYGPVQGEVIARDLWWEQIDAHPDRYAVDVIQSVLGFAGFYYNQAGDLTALHHWFSDYLVNVPLLDANNLALDGYQGFRYISSLEHNGQLLEVWSETGLLYLRIVRPAVNTALVLALIIYLWRFLRSKPLTVKQRDVILLVFATAYASSAFLHILTLAVNDRFVSSYDLIAVFLLLLTLDTLAGQSLGEMIQ